MRTAGWRVDDEDPGAEHHHIEHHKGDEPGDRQGGIPCARGLDREDAPTGWEGRIAVATPFENPVTRTESRTTKIIQPA